MKLQESGGGGREADDEVRENWCQGAELCGTLSATEGIFAF